MKKKLEELTDSRVEEVGLLMPVLQHRWSFHIENDVDNLIDRQITKLEIDYVKMEISLSVIQPAKDVKLQQYIMNIANGNLHVCISMLSGKGDTSSTLEFEVVMAEHKFVLDYANDGDTAKHEIILKIR